MAKKRTRPRRNRCRRSSMKLKVLLPYQVYAEIAGVKRIVAETPQGSFGLLPYRLDCVAVLEPGILTYETEAGGEVYVAVDQGVLVKACLLYTSDAADE